MIGFIGPKDEAVKLLTEIANFLDTHLGMQLNIEKSGVVHHKKGIKFLGYKIFGHYDLNVK